LLLATRNSSLLSLIASANEYRYWRRTVNNRNKDRPRSLKDSEVRLAPITRATLIPCRKETSWRT
jgi:hypothetical protein